MHPTTRSPFPLSLLSWVWCALSVGASTRIPLYRVPRLDSVSRRFSGVNVDLSLETSNQFAYLVNVSIGGEEFMVLLDTGSSDLWVVSSDCSTSDCEGVQKYTRTPSLSQTDVPFHLNYLVGNVSGTVGAETVTLGEFQVSSQIFAMAEETNGLGLHGTGNSGIMGLSFPAEAAISDTTGRTVVENLFSAFNDTSRRFFAFKLGRDQTSSSFTIGELDPAFANATDDMTYNPVFASGGALYDYWKLPLQSLTVNGTSFALAKSRMDGAPAPIAVLDTGTTLVLGPSQDVARFWASVGGARQTDRGWEVPCNRAVVVGLVLGEGTAQKEYTVDPADISWKEGSVDNVWCLGGVQSNDEVYSADWLLGDTFLRNVYVTHHAANDTQPPKIGLRGLTDPAAALAAFIADRGADSGSPAQVLSQADHTNSLTGGGICGIATASGFVAGAVILVLVFSLTGYRRKY
ncbi:acid protease [Trametes versicolor FP-101664 SS1]|uniref:acid protease n=1 Tax=Trametes versicolor (strain FP-101664) TaxID=717944 RepID=UPI00046237C4|nr:acid protease [Trametes versicolor FP-101664 SS1]EIW60502.1 acid protease [Trametes versicolor FP-101664 SS1]